MGDGNYYEYSANTILENPYMQADDQLASNSMLEAIIDHETDKYAVPKCKGW